MQLIANGTQVGTTPPAPQTPIGTPGYIQNATPGAGVTPTVIDPDANNALIAELANACIGAGVALAPGVFTQLAQAMRRLGAANVTSIAASGALTVDEVGLVLGNAGAGNVVLTLPAAAGMNGYPVRFGVVRTDSTANTVTIAAAGADTFLSPSGATVPAPTLAAGAPRLELVSNGVAGWLVLQDVHGESLIASTGNWTVPQGVYAAQFEAWGGGGAGAGAATMTSTQNNGSGGSGAYGRKFVSGLVPGSTISITIGAAGAGGAGSGGSGGTTTVGAYFSVAGGGGGAFNTGGGGAGGAAPTGVDLAIAGSPGSVGIFSSTTPLGFGGAAPRGGAGGLCSISGGSAGTFPGGAGGAGMSTVASTNGGSGAAGAVLVRW